MIPIEIGESSPRITLFEPAKNEEELRTNLDLLQEVREIAHIKEYAVKARTARRSGVEKNYVKGGKQQVDAYVGRTLQSCRRCGKGHVPSGALGRLSDSSYLERRQLKKVF
ncbi:hypothetical protein CR513_20173, partial [Mucuna pruriens]